MVQELDPLGTGARSLAECLLLQLAQSRHFNPLSVRMVSQGLELLAEKDYSRLAALLRADPGAVRRTAQIVRSLNPLPSRGFPSGDDTVYIVPEATVTCEGDSVLIQLNSAGLPSLSIQPYYRSLLEGGEHPEAQEYLRDYLREARDMIAAQENRARTIEKLIIRIVQLQMDHFLSGAPLRAMTMSQLAEGMELSVSTVSRLVKDKYLLFAGAPIPLRSFFTAPVRGEDHALSAEEIRQELRRFIRLEDPAHPLSDEALAASLSGVGIPISRRTVAKYRQEEGIPPAARRKSPAKTKNECEE